MPERDTNVPYPPQLLNTNAASELSSMYDHMADVGTTFSKKPLNLDQLAEQIKLLESEQASTATWPLLDG